MHNQENTVYALRLSTLFKKMNAAIRNNDSSDFFDTHYEAEKLGIITAKDAFAQKAFVDSAKIDALENPAITLEEIEKILREVNYENSLV